METIKRQLRYQFQDIKAPFIVFWLIILGVNVGMYLSNSNLGGSVGVSYNNLINVAGSNIISIAIFIIVSSMEMYYESFPAAVGFSSPRRDFYIGAVLYNLILVLSMAIIQGICLKLDGYIIEFIGREPLYDFLIFNLKQDNIVYIILILCMFFLVFSAVFNLLGALLYRFTAKLWIVIAVAAIFISNIRPIRLFLESMKNLFFPVDNFALLVIMQLILSVILYSLAYLVIRRLAIRSAR